MTGVKVAGLTIPRRSREYVMLWDLAAEYLEKRLPKGLRIVWPTRWIYQRMPERN